MIGNDCPDCGYRLTSDRCRCGWRAQQPERGDCDECAAIRKRTDRSHDFVLAAHCERCGTHSTSTTAFHPDGAPEDRGARLCPSCWVSALRRRAQLDPITPEDRQRCMAKIKRLDVRFPSVRPA